jgi:hypothetical protein
MTGGISLRALSLMTALAVFDGPWAHAARTTSLGCTAIGMGDIILMRAHFEESGSGTRIFRTEFWAKHRFGAGRRMAGTVAGVSVGTFKLQPVVGGDVAGEMTLNDAPVPGDHSKPFPSDFPAVEPKANIAIEAGDRTVLSCRLE